MTAPNLAAALLRDVPRYDASAVMWTLEDVEPKPTADGKWFCYTDVLAALSRALDPAIAERAGEVLEALLHEERIATSAEAVDFRSTADLITTLLAQNAALRAERDEALEWLSASQGYIADAVFALDKQEKAEAERDALRAERDEARENSDSNFRTAKRYLDRIVAAEAQIAALTARVEGLTGAVWLKVGECLAGMTHREVSQEARARIKRALDAALSATTEEGK